MQLSRKVDNKAPVIKADSSYKENKGFKVCLDTEVPNGKYKGKTGHWIATNDPGYMKWLLQEDILIGWGIIKSPIKVQTNYTHFLSSKGEYWIDIRTVEAKTNPSIFLED